ncbi:hypothetical protein ACKUB1_08335 [Methanospirillum stamsii]|uniref:Uncharacterized protein n=1 Tax=Methanospirillum stamsii TaxID=1277351 RepID=A0A2V2N6J3_9EURY|nr:hypothetical protein [Methanospirillum stamsii]PWR75704.1 hypothetical protein DLD82_03745 [Methanospirillum stamsii]
MVVGYWISTGKASIRNNEQGKKKMLTYETGREPDRIIPPLHEERVRSCTGSGPRSDPPPEFGILPKSGTLLVHRS